jgi:hypothetical protein
MSVALGDAWGEGPDSQGVPAIKVDSTAQRLATIPLSNPIPLLSAKASLSLTQSATHLVPAIDMPACRNGAGDLQQLACDQV